MTVKQVFNTSAELDYPTVLPTLDLDFANSKTLDPRITFTRASGGSYIGADGLIKYAGVNEARFDHDPATGESLGLLIEEGRTNLLTNSNNLATDNVNFLITANSIVSPDGSVNASKMTEKTTFDFKILLKIYTSVPNTTYCHSLFVKAGERDTMLLKNTQPGDIGNTAITVDMSTGKITQVFGSPSNYGIIKYPNGWWRIYCTYVPTGTAGYFQIFLRNSSSTLYQGDGSSGFYIYGSQVEQGSFPTSYIPTLSTTRTRQPDVAKINNANLQSVFPSSLWNENTFYAEAYGGIGDGTNPMVFEGFTSPPSIVHTTLSIVPSQNRLRGQVRQGNARFESLNFSQNVSTKFNQKFKAAIRTYSRTDNTSDNILPNYSNYPSTLMAIDGVLVSKTSSNIARTDWNINSELSIGSRQLYGSSNFSSFWNNSISRISLYPKALLDSQMSSLTS